MTPPSATSRLAPFDLPLEQRSIGRFLRLRARDDGDRPYLTIDGRTYSFAQTERICRNLARGLARHGIGEGSRVLLMLPNCAEFLFVWYAASLLGAAIVPINTALKGTLLEPLLAEAKPDAAIIDAQHLATWQSIPSQARRSIALLAIVGNASNAALPAGAIDITALAADGDDDSEAPFDFRRIQVISYTSGSTGPAKGVMIPHAQVFSSACGYIRVAGMTREDVLYSPLPLFHGLSSRMCALSTLVLGAHCVIDRHFSASRYWQRAAACNATLGFVVHAIVALIKAQPPGAFDRAHRVRAIFNAAHDTEFEARFGVRTLEAFSLTETSFLLYTPYPERTLGSTGRPHEDWELDLVDENDVPVSIGSSGELVARPRRPWIMMDGYLDRPQATLESWRNLWFHTGDILRRDEANNYFYVDRKKERIRRRGENVSSFDVERAVSEHPAILECVVLAHPAGDGEDDIRLVAVPKSGMALGATTLHVWLQERLPKFMLPRYIELVSELPRGATSKVDKRRLIERGLGPDTFDAGSP